MKTDNDLIIAGEPSDEDAAGNDLHSGCGPESARGGATALTRANNRLSGPQSAPPALLAFLNEVSVSDAADALGMSRKQVHRVRHGYWPADSRKIMAAWVAYQGRSAAVASSWFLRRVQADARVRQGAHVYTGPRLGEHVGKLLALARTVDGGLVAQTLGGQPRLMVLERLEA
jgi:hypothetical protein